MVQNWPYLNVFLYRQYRPGKFLLRYFRTIKSVFRLSNKRLKKSKNWHISKGVIPWFWSKNGQFTKFFFLGNIAQENVFYDILERKKTFLGYKNKKFKMSENWIFFKGFCSNNGPFFNFYFLGNIGQENVFYDILD